MKWILLFWAVAPFALLNALVFKLFWTFSHTFTAGAVAAFTCVVMDIFLAVLLMQVSQKE